MPSFTKFFVFCFALLWADLSQGETVLLKNESSIVPIQNLELFDLHIVTIGVQQPSKILERVSFHKAVTTHVKTMDDLDEVKTSVGEMYLFVIGSQQDNRLRDWLSRSPNIQSIVCFIDRPPVAIEHADAIVYHNPKVIGDELALIDLIWGVEPFEGILSRDFGDFDLGQGLTTAAQLRLGYPDLLQAYAYRPLQDSMDVIMKEAIDARAFPGAQLLVVHDNEVVIDKVYGHRTYEAAKPVQHQDLYDLASITKVSSAVPALMYMLDQKLINLDDPLCDHLPSFCRSDKKTITLRQALAHNGRLQPYIVYWQAAIKKNGKFKARSFHKELSSKYVIKITDSLFLHRKYKRKIDRAIKKSDLNPEPGYVYSGLTFLLYPDLVREKLDLPIDSFLYQYYYWPLGAESLTYRPLDRFSLGDIVPTEIDTVFRNQLVHGMVHDEAAAMLDGVSCNAGLFSNARDLAKLSAMFLNKGTYGGKRFISEEVVQEFIRCAFCSEGNRRGLGFDKPLLAYNPRYSYVAESASPESFGHSGFTGTFFWMDPTNKTILILLSNRVYPSRNQRSLYTLGIRPRLHQAIYDFLDHAQ
ncbi:MAG: beta-lactamase family protein [Saprospiraceae bacterium]|nr:beta-lactamase family protein [Saprospiraceae bacterium]